MLRTLLTLTSLQFALSGLASACSCVGSERPCEYLRSDYVFAGRVLATEPITHEDGRFTYVSGYSMRFAVEESLRGDLGTRVNVETGSGGGDCGTPLEPGGTFLIFAYRGEDGSLRTGLCSGNQVLSGNPLEDELVAQYRSLIKSGKGTIFGRVSRMKPQWRGDDVANPGPPTMVEGLSLKAVSSTSSFSAKTGSNGSYEFAGLPKGEYTVTPELDSAFDFDREYPDRYQVSLGEGQCANISFQLAPNTRIRGHVERPKELNLEHVEVVAIPTDMKDLNQFSGKWDFTDENHHFDLWPLPPGDYYVGVNINSSPKEDSPFPPTYYPGVTSKEAASVIHLREGDIKELELPLPEIAKRRSVHFVAIGLDGKPMNKIYIQLEDLRHPGDAASYVNVDLDAQGTGTTTIYSGYSYHLHGSQWVGGTDWCAKPVLIPAGTKPVEVEFVMDHAARSCWIKEIDGLAN